MIYLYGLEKIAGTKYKVTRQHYKPFDEQYGLHRTQEELEQEGILVENLPNPEAIPYKNPVLYCNPQTKEVWYEYEDRPLTPEEEMRQRIELMQQALDALLLGGM